MGEWAHVNDRYGQNIIGFDGAVFKRRLRELMAMKAGIVLCANENLDTLCGALIGAYYKEFFSDKPCTSEILWYVVPGSPKGTGTKLLEAFEEWSRSKGAKRITMGYMVHNEERLESFYQKRGYVPFEKHFFKLL